MLLFKFLSTWLHILSGALCLGSPHHHPALTLPLCVYDAFVQPRALQPPSGLSNPLPPIPTLRSSALLATKGGRGDWTLLYSQFFLVTYREELYTDENTRHKGILGMKATQLRSVRHV